jgi:hypothetical protein
LWLLLQTKCPSNHTTPRLARQGNNQVAPYVCKVPIDSPVQAVRPKPRARAYAGPWGSTLRSIELCVRSALFVGAIAGFDANACDEGEPRRLSDLSLEELLLVEIAPVVMAASQAPLPFANKALTTSNRFKAGASRRGTGQPSLGKSRNEQKLRPASMDTAMHPLSSSEHARITVLIAAAGAEPHRVGPQ